MTTSLRSVITKIGKLSVAEQNAIAEMLSEELQWEKSFSSSQNELLMLAGEAMAEYKSGKTKPLKLK